VENFSKIKMKKLKFFILYLMWGTYLSMLSNTALRKFYKNKKENGGLVEKGKDYINLSITNILRDLTDHWGKRLPLCTLWEIKALFQMLHLLCIYRLFLYMTASWQSVFNKKPKSYMSEEKETKKIRNLQNALAFMTEILTFNFEMWVRGRRPHYLAPWFILHFVYHLLNAFQRKWSNLQKFLYFFSIIKN
jgi:hypothetical protein